MAFGATPGQSRFGLGDVPWGTVGTVAGGVIDLISNERSNKANAQNVQKQIDFQQNQSETQWQRAVADMKAAGLNPALAYQQGGNGQQSGAAADNKPYHGAADAMGRAMDLYQSFANGAAQRDLIRQQASTAQAQELNLRMDAGAKQPAYNLGHDEDYISKYIADERAKRGIGPQMYQLGADKLKADIANTNQGTATAKQAATTSAQSAELMRKQGTILEQQFVNKWFKDNMLPYINSTAKTVTPFLNFLPKY